MSVRKHIPEIGNQYGDLTVISDEISKTKDGKILFNVRCSCGEELFVRAYFLESGRQTSCRSCSQRRAVYKFSNRRNFVDRTHDGVGNITLTNYSHFKNGAEKRNLSWNVSIEYLWDLFQKQGGRCVLSGMPITLTTERKNSNVNYDLQSASLDRIDSNIGYEPNNVQWVHKDVNKMKWAFDQQHFIDVCIKIANHANQQPSQE